MCQGRSAAKLRMTGAAGQEQRLRTSHEADELKLEVHGAYWGDGDGLTKPIRWSLSTALSCHSVFEGVIGRRKYEEGCTKQFIRVRPVGFANCEWGNKDPISALIDNVR